jgi:hypothetical protein
MPKFEALYRFGSEPWFGTAYVEAEDLKGAIGAFFESHKNVTLVNIHMLGDQNPYNNKQID